MSERKEVVFCRGKTAEELNNLARKGVIGKLDLQVWVSQQNKSLKGIKWEVVTEGEDLSVKCRQLAPRTHA